MMKHSTLQLNSSKGSGSSKENSLQGNIKGRAISHLTSLMNKSLSHQANDQTDSFQVKNNHLGKENLRHSNIDRNVPRLSHQHIDTSGVLANYQEFISNQSFSSIPSPGVEIIPRKRLSENNNDVDSDDEPFFYGKAEPSSTYKLTSADEDNSQYDDDWDDNVKPKPTKEFVSIKNPENHNLNATIDPLTQKLTSEYNKRRKDARIFLAKQKQKFKEEKEKEKLKQIEDKLKMQVKLAELDKKRRERLKSATEDSKINRSEMFPIKLPHDSVGDVSANIRGKNNQDDSSMTIANVLQSPQRTQNLHPSRYTDIVDEVLNEYRRSIDKIREKDPIPKPSQYMLNIEPSKTSQSEEYPRSTSNIPKPFTGLNANLFDESKSSKPTSFSLFDNSYPNAKRLNPVSDHTLPTRSNSNPRSVIPTSSSTLPSSTTKRSQRHSTSPGRYIKSTAVNIGKDSNRDTSRRRREATSRKDPIPPEARGKRKTNQKRKSSKSKENKYDKSSEKNNTWASAHSGDVTDMIAKRNYSEHLIQEIERLESSLMPISKQTVEYVNPITSIPPDHVEVVQTNIKSVQDVLAEVDRMSAVLRELTRELEEQVSANTSVRDSVDLNNSSSVTGTIGVMSHSGASRSTTSRSVLRQSLAEKIDAVLASVYEKNEDEESEQSSEDDIDDSSSEDVTRLTQSSPTKESNYSAPIRSYEDTDAVRMDDSVSDDEDNETNTFDTAESREHGRDAELVPSRKNDLHFETKDSLLTHQLGAIQDHKNILDRYNSDANIAEVLGNVKEQDNLIQISSNVSNNAPREDTNQESIMPDLIYFRKPQDNEHAINASQSSPQNNPNEGLRSLSFRNIGQLAGNFNTNESDKWRKLDEERDIEWSDEDEEDSSEDLRMVTLFANKMLDHRLRKEQEEKRQLDIDSRISVAKDYIREHQESIMMETRIPDVIIDQPSISKYNLTHSQQSSSPVNMSKPLSNQETFWDSLLRREYMENPTVRLRSSLSPKAVDIEATNFEEKSESQSSPRLTAADMRLEVIEELRRQEELMKAAVELADLQQVHAVNTAAELIHQVLSSSQQQVEELQRRQEIALQQQAYEVSLASAMNAAHLQLQEETSSREQQLETLRNEVHMQKIKAAYDKVVEQAAIASRNLEQTSELLAIERELRPPPYPKESQLTSKSPQVKQNLNKSTKTSVISMYGSPARKAKDELENSSVLYDDEIEEDIPLQSDKDTNDDAYSLSFDDERSKTSTVLSKSKPVSISKVNQQSHDYSDTFEDDVPEDIQEDFEYKENLSSLDKKLFGARTSNRTISRQPSASLSRVSDEYPESFDSISTIRDSKSKGLTSSMNLRQQKSVEQLNAKDDILSNAYKEQVPKIDQAFSSVIAYRQDLDEVIAAYRFDLNQRLKSYEKTFDMKLGLINSRLQQRLEQSKNYPETKRSQCEQYAYEEFAISKSKLERDRWAVYARAYKDLKQVKKMKRQADSNRKNIQASSFELHENDDYRETSSSESDEEILEDFRNLQPVNKQLLQSADESEGKPPRGKNIHSMTQKLTKLRVNHNVENAASDDDRYSNDFDASHEIEEEKQNDDVTDEVEEEYQQSQQTRESYEDDYEDDIEEDIALQSLDRKPNKSVYSSHAKSESSDNYSADFDAGVGESTDDRLILRASLSSDRMKNSIAPQPLKVLLSSNSMESGEMKDFESDEESNPNAIPDLDPALKDLDSSINRRRSHIENIKSKLNRLRDERHKLRQIHNIQEILRMKQEERSQLINIESELLSQLQRETEALQRERDQLIRSTQSFQIPFSPTNPLSAKESSDSFESKENNVDTGNYRFHDVEQMNKWKEELKSAEDEAVEESFSYGISDDSFISENMEDSGILRSDIPKSIDSHIDAKRIPSMDLLSAAEDNLLVQHARVLRAHLCIQSLIRMYLAKRRVNLIRSSIKKSKVDPIPSSVATSVLPLSLGHHQLDEYTATNDVVNNYLDDSFGSEVSENILDESNIIETNNTLLKKMENIASTMKLRDNITDQVHHGITASDRDNLVPHHVRDVSIDSSLPPDDESRFNLQSKYRLDEDTTAHDEGIRFAPSSHDTKSSYLLDNSRDSSIESENSIIESFSSVSQQSSPKSKETISNVVEKPDESFFEKSPHTPSTNDRKSYLDSPDSFHDSSNIDEAIASTAETNPNASFKSDKSLSMKQTQLSPSDNRISHSISESFDKSPDEENRSTASSKNDHEYITDDNYSDSFMSVPTMEERDDMKDLKQQTSISIMSKPSIMPELPVEHDKDSDDLEDIDEEEGVLGDDSIESNNNIPSETLETDNVHDQRYKPTSNQTNSADTVLDDSNDLSSYADDVEAFDDEKLSPPTSDSELEEVKGSNILLNKSSGVQGDSDVTPAVVAKSSVDDYSNQIEESKEISNLSEDDDENAATTKGKLKLESSFVKDEYSDHEDLLDDSGNDTIPWELHSPVATSTNSLSNFNYDLESSNTLIPHMSSNSLSKSPIEQQSLIGRNEIDEDIEKKPINEPNQSAESQFARSTPEDDVVLLSERIADELLKRLFTDEVMRSRQAIPDLTIDDRSTASKVTKLSPSPSNDDLSPPETPLKLVSKKDHGNVVIEQISETSSPSESSPPSSLRNIPPITIHRVSSALTSSTTFISSVDNDQQLIQQISPKQGDQTSPPSIHLKPWEPNVIMPSTIVHPTSPPHLSPPSKSPSSLSDNNQDLYDFDIESKLLSEASTTIPSDIEEKLIAYKDDDRALTATPIRRSVAVLMEECTNVLLDDCDFDSAIQRLLQPEFKGEFIDRKLTTDAEARIAEAMSEWKPDLVQTTMTVTRDRMNEIVSELHASRTASLISGSTHLGFQSLGRDLPLRLIAESLMSHQSNHSAADLSSAARKLKYYVGKILDEENRKAVVLLRSGGMSSELVRIDPIARVEEEYQNILREDVNIIADTILSRIIDSTITSTLSNLTYS